MIKNIKNIVVSFVIVARNASKFLPHILSDFLNQDYSVENCELILIDSGSTDNTNEIFENFYYQNPNIFIRIYKNTKISLSSGWNIALKNALGDIIIRVDAHTRIPNNFISTNVNIIMKGEKIVGGPRITILPEYLENKWGWLISLAELSKFGGGPADFRHNRIPKYVDTLAHAAYCREVFKNIGGFDERLIRNQDIEIHSRMIEAGYKFYFTPEIKTYHKPRYKLIDLILQKLLTGFWLGPVLAIRPKAIRPRHMIPGLFVISLLSFSLLAIYGLYLPLFFLLFLYLIGSFIFSLKLYINPLYKQTKIICILPTIFFLIHLFYGIGTIAGILYSPFIYINNLSYILPFPIQKSISK
jgi:glycosyltransferase involved in cell wall biosynthesis